ncbi:DUF1835 domain-containing protein [Clostridium sp.]|uniref:DUF1835 domain-containing protein n=1 Tax=Clostridium sp. TaxID=1506 RepID=UPI0025C0FFD4|nr:DUF1835 domain-containing protein [Clostridium sp.]
MISIFLSEEYASKGEKLRIWYSNAAYSLCELYYVCNFLKKYKCKILVIKLPSYMKFSLILSILGILFTFSFSNKVCYGDIILKYIGLNPWSNGNSGTHYTVLYSLIFFIPSFILGYKFKNDYGVKAGRIISFIMITLIIIVFPLFSAVGL